MGYQGLGRSLMAMERVDGPLVYFSFGSLGVADVDAGAGNITNDPQLTLRYVVALPIIVLVIFGAIFLSDKAKGGYKAETLGGGDTE